MLRKTLKLVMVQFMKLFSHVLSFILMNNHSISRRNFIRPSKVKTNHLKLHIGSQMSMMIVFGRLKISNFLQKLCMTLKKKLYINTGIIQKKQKVLHKYFIIAGKQKSIILMEM